VKLNTAAVLKEGHLVKKQSEEVIKKLNDLENGNGNPIEFLKWQDQMKQIDLEKNEVDSMKRKLQSKLAYEEAILAREQAAAEKKKKAELIKNETKELGDIKQVKRENEMSKIKENVEKIKQDRDYAKEIQAKIVEEKQKSAKAINEESEYLRKIAIEEVRDLFFKNIKVFFISTTDLEHFRLKLKLRREWS
jgi:hypothetical protein